VILYYKKFKEDEVKYILTVFISKSGSVSRSKKIAHETYENVENQLYLDQIVPL